MNRMGECRWFVERRMRCDASRYRPMWCRLSLSHQAGASTRHGRVKVDASRMNPRSSSKPCSRSDLTHDTSYKYTTTRSV